MKLKKLFGSIQKVSDQDDGSIVVEGIASTESIDDQGETVTAAAMKAAIPDYMKFGAVREMHQLIAAGTALDVSVGDDGVTTIKAHIVDEGTIKKVKSGVLKGFSIGGKVTSRDDLVKTAITGLKLSEISLVDRPCNPDSVITCYKADGIEQPEHEDVQKAEGADTLRKSLYEVKEFAGVLRDISYLVAEAQWEADCEGDNSPLPANLLEWLKSGVVLFNDMAAEETAEMVAQLESIVTKAQGADDLQKAGQKFSKSTKAQLAEVHQMMKTCSDKMAAIGYDAADDDESEKAQVTDDLSKAAKPDLVSNEVAALAKAAGIELKQGDLHADIAKAALTKVGELSKRVTELEELPTPPKGSLADISKAADMGQEKAEVQPIMKSDGTVDETGTLIKAALANPIRVF